jgi:hypothetical protein
MGPVMGHGPEPAQIIGTATGLVNAANRPSAAVDGVIRSVLIGPGAKAGRTHGESHVLLFERDDDLFPSLQVF